MFRIWFKYRVWYSGGTNNKWNDSIKGKLMKILNYIILLTMCSCSTYITQEKECPIKEFSSTWTDMDQFYYNEFDVEYAVWQEWEENVRPTACDRDIEIRYQIHKKNESEIIEKALHDGYTHYRIEKISREPRLKALYKYLKEKGFQVIPKQEGE